MHKELSYLWTFILHIDAQGVIKPKALKVSDAFKLHNDHKILIPFGRFLSPIKEAGGLYSGVLGQLAGDTCVFPINHKTWRNVPKDYKTECWEKMIKVLHSFSLTHLII